MNVKPPRWADRFLEWYCRPDLLEEIQGDAYELFYKEVKQNGRRRARLKFAWNVLRFFRWKNIKRSKKNTYPSNSSFMIRHNLLIGLRSLLGNKTQAIINLTGLSIGLAGFILISLFVRHELSFDKYHENKDQISRLILRHKPTSEPDLAKIHGPVGPVLKSEIPEIKSMVRFSPVNSKLMAYGDQKNYEPNGLYADPTAFEIFSFKVLAGNPSTALVKPNSIVLTKTLAQKYFKDENPIGKIMLLDNQFPMEVSGVLQDVPLNSHFTFSFLLSIEADARGWRDNWKAPWQYYTYLLLDPFADADAVSQKATEIISRYAPPENDARELAAELQPLTKIHLYSHLARELGVNGSMQTIYIYSGIGLFLLLIACVNFINMMTAKATTRLKEVCIRKTVGAVKKQLIGQFLSETFLLTFFSFAVSVGIVYFVLPQFNRLTGVTLDLSILVQRDFLIVLGSVLVAVAFLAGVYPAIYLASLNPLQLQKGVTVTGKKSLRMGLVLFQFCISAFFILSFQVISQQTSFMQNKDLGYDKELIINIPLHDSKSVQKIDLLKTKLKENSKIADVAFSANLLGGSDYGIPVKPEGIADENIPGIRMLIVDQDFVNTYGMKIIEGRNFSEDIPTDKTSSYLINEAGAKALGWDNPIGKKMSMPVIGREEGSVVGVLKDFNFRSLRESIQPIIFFVNPEWFSTASIKINSENISETISFLEKQWKEIEPDYPFTYNFFDESISRMYAAELRTQSIVKYASIVAILIACIGLFSLASFNVERHKKEFAIRKVLGASVVGIVMIQLRQYTVLAIVGSGIASILAFLVMGKWFDNFAYKTTIGPETFLIAIFAVLIICLITVSVRCVKAGMTNPARVLKTE
jgi:putative ABC transport system permease protein